jgi:hypothetical protein
LGSQKDQNRLVLFFVLALNAVVLYALVTTQRIEPSAWLNAIADLHGALPVAFALALTGILNSQLAPKTKERIVFWEWEHPLPGCRAFSLYMHRDDRIDVAALSARFGPFPSEPAEQNRRWYKIYSEVRDELAVVSASRGYLLGRDYASLLALIIPVFGVVSLLQVRSPLYCILYIAFLLLQLALATNSARLNASRLVTTAMALASTRQGISKNG